eukprot:2683142-Pyramimonas_sp.AAC.1
MRVAVVSCPRLGPGVHPRCERVLVDAPVRARPRNDVGNERLDLGLGHGRRRRRVLGLGFRLRR